MAKEAYYFSHDANCHDDPKIMLLIDQFGMEGYGIFWSIIEKLRTEPTYTLPFLVIPALAKRWGTSTEKVKTIVCNFSLFTVTTDLFFSERLKRSMIEKSEKGKYAANLRWKNAPALPLQCEGNATAMQNDAKKGKEKKEKESKCIAPTITQVKEYFKENGYSEESAVKAFTYYEANSWKDSKGSPVKAWKQKMIGVWFKEENKIPSHTSRMVW